MGAVSSVANSLATIAHSSTLTFGLRCSVSHAPLFTGGIIFGDRSIKLPIAGEGYFDVMYMDREIPLRIFRGSNGSLAVQVLESVVSGTEALDDHFQD